MVLESELKVKERKTKQLEKDIFQEQSQRNKEINFEVDENEMNYSETDNFETQIETLIRKKTKYSIESMNYHYQESSNLTE